MAERVFTEGLLFLGALNLTAQIRETALVVSAEVQDVTSLADASRNRLGGLKDVSLSAAGYFSAAEPDSSLYSGVGVSGSLITAAPTDTLGDPSFFFRAVVGEYSPIQGAVGEVAGFTLNAAAYLGDLIRGTLMENGEVTGTGNGTGRQLGAVAADESVYAGVHITSISGNWDIILESDDNSGFTTATTRASWTGQTAVGELFASVAGAITDTYWRFRFVENSAGSLTLAASVGIQ